MGRTMGPSLSGYLRSKTEFRNSEAIIGLSIGSFAILYGIFGGGLKAFSRLKKEKNNQDKLIELKGDSEMIETRDKMFYYLEEEGL